jgi:CHAT domain-containing protein
VPILKLKTAPCIQYGETTVKDAANTNTPWQYLEGTKSEIDRVSTLFKKKNIKFEVKKGFLASEEALKAKNTEGVSPNILHLATHGFFYKNKQDISTKSAFQTAINPLIRSGLIMANANKAWLGEALQEGREDGILTAYEISNMNLSQTHLVVLSACETGLGDIQGTEGVYGLQRAFKMAGVEYILMSLWQVPDKQTAELMEQFYTHLLNGVPLQEAFSKAQQRMKEKYAPYYWAGFVLVR